MKNQVITQSLIKELFEYTNKGGCGLQFAAKYIHGIEFPSSDAMKLGQWFEFMCTGQPTKFGHIPEPVRLKAKKLTKTELDEGMKQEDVVGALSKKYQDALIQVERFKRMLDYFEYEVVDTGMRIIDKELNIQGDIDLVVKKKGSGKDGKLSFIDMKFSGLLENKWDDLGWADDALEYKDKIMIQAVHYKMLGRANLGYEPDFYFWVFSSTNTTDCKNIKVIVDDETFTEHERTIFATRKRFEQEDKNGWIPKPTPKACAKCPLKSECKYVVDIPMVQQVVYGLQA